MKKIKTLLSFITVLFIVCSAFYVSADGGVTSKGKFIPFAKWSVNAPSKGSQAKVVTITDDPVFNNVYQYQYYGNYTTATLKSMINFDAITDYQNGDKVHLSFYYRYRTGDIGENTYVAPSNIKFDNEYGTKHAKAYEKTAKISEDWQKADINTTIGGTNNYYSVFLYAANVSDKICVEIAEPELYYFGNMENSDIESELAKCEIKSLKVGTTDVDLEQNPTSYTSEDVIISDDISATTYYENKAVAIEQLDNESTSEFTIVSYAPNYNLITKTGDKTEYTVIGKRPIIHLANDDFGYALISNDGNLVSSSSSSNGCVKVNKVSNSNITSKEPFGDYYSWQFDKFENEGENNQNFIRIHPDSQPAEAPQIGGYVYVSFYYRTYNRFENQSGMMVDGGKLRLYPSITVGNADNAYYRLPGVKYFDAEVDNASYDDIQQWKRISWIQPLEAGDGDMSFKLSCPFRKSNGAISCDNGKIDIAQVELVYFGVPYGTTDNSTLINEKIANALNSFELKSVTVNGKNVLLQNPESYSCNCNLPKSNVCANNIWDQKFVKKVKLSDYETKYIAYAPEYDWLDETDDRKSEYTVNIHTLQSFNDFSIEFEDVEISDFSSFKPGDYTIKFDVSNESEEQFTAIALVAAYDGNNIIEIETANVYSDGKTIDKPISLNISTDQNPTSFKVFVLNDINSIKPLISSKTINQNGIN